MTTTRLEQIQERIAGIKKELVAIDEMRPGSLTRQYKDPKGKTGPYYQLSYTRDMKSRTQYVPRDCVSDLRRQIANYKRFKSLTEKWIDLSIECSRLKMKLQRTP
jgi:intergrase/recombinase